MILFKRVGESFGKIEGREWALLALETFGVVAGILIAFELNEWAERRGDAQRHHQLMERLFQESEQDVAATRDLRDSMRVLVKKEDEFATILGRGECPPDELWGAVDTLGMYPSLQAPRSVYQELMGAGGLSSIGNGAVRAAVAQFNASFDWAQSQNDFFRTNLEAPVRTDDPRATLRYDSAAAEPEVSRYDHPALCADHGFRNRMASATRNHVVIAGFHDEVTERAIAMCGSLGWALGRECQPAFGGKLSAGDSAFLRKSLASLPKSQH